MAPTDNTMARTLHDLGLAAWFGGSLMGATGLNGAAAVVQDPSQRLRVANSGWARWTPLNLAGIVAHLAGGGGPDRGQPGPARRPAGRGRHQRGQDRLDLWPRLAAPLMPACWARSWSGPVTS
jgi:hypothetical protein